MNELEPYYRHLGQKLHVLPRPQPVKDGVGRVEN